MGTRNQTNAKFHNEVHEILGHHESSIDQVHATLQTVLTELQSLRTSQNHSQPLHDINPFAPTESSQHINPPSASYSHPSNTHGSNDQNHHLKLKFSKFSGEDPQGWIFKAEQYFEFKEVATEQQVQLASFHLEGIALQWYRWLAKFKGPVTWVEFTKASLLRFGPTDYEDPSEALTRLKQTTTVSAYQEEFEKLSHRVDELPEKFLIRCFVAGLKDDIKLDVKIKQPRSLTEVICVARLVEERNGLQKKGVTNFRGKITSQEVRKRREKGLCYYCDERFIPGNSCQRPQMVMIEDMEDINEETQEGLNEQSHEELIPKISFHAIAGTTHPQTIRLQGRKKGKEVTILVDGGSTHNFVDQSLFNKFGLTVNHDHTFQVMVANREKIESLGRCLALTLEIQGYQVMADFYVLPIAACPLVLGVQWLATLGHVEIDYKELTMTFKEGGKANAGLGSLRLTIWVILYQ
ncbi:hypothetical protein ACOSQ2_008087 [Xanthoceras sorbifolium]